MVFVKPLDFGQANVVVAVPDAWIDVTHMADLADVASDFRLRHGRWLRIATKYVHLTRKFFADWGIAEYRIVESAGATEAAPASGTADLIVDITSSGETLVRQRAARAGGRAGDEERGAAHRLQDRASGRRSRKPSSKRCCRSWAAFRRGPARCFSCG